MPSQRNEWIAERNDEYQVADMPQSVGKAYKELEDLTVRMHPEVMTDKGPSTELGRIMTEKFVEHAAPSCVHAAFCSQQIEVSPEGEEGTSARLKVDCRLGDMSTELSAKLREEECRKQHKDTEWAFRKHIVTTVNSARELDTQISDAQKQIEEARRTLRDLL